MTGRQKLMQWVYPLLTFLGKKTGVNGKIKTGNVASQTSFYHLSATQNDGTEINFQNFKNKKVVIVNTASDCGYTNQYAALQALHETHKNNIIIIGFPANDFKEQEKADDAGIANFCAVNFGVSFPLIKKSVVIKKEDQHPVYEWLSNQTKNGWNNSAPTWNFCKYIINEEGNLTHFFEAGIAPDNPNFVKALQA
jgi:glutathione peroxidase